MPTLVGGRGLTAIARLQRALKFQDDTRSIENHVERIRERLDRGITTGGEAFKPLKSSGRKPLESASKWFDDAKFSAETTSEGIRFSASVYGRAAMLIRVHNETRPFLGFSSNDKTELARSLVSSIRENFKRWR